MRLIHNLINTSSRATKINLLRNAVSLEHNVFVYAYDYNKTYFMKSLGRINYRNLGEPSNAMFSLLDDILARRVTGKLAKEMVLAHAAEHGDLIKIIIGKNLRCGVTAKTLNAALPGSLDTFDIQKATEIPISEMTFPLVCEVKYDGVRLITEIDGNTITFRSSGGKEAKLPELHKALSVKLPYNCILDGELTYKEGKDNQRTTISGMFNSAMKGGTIDETDVVYNVFDRLSIDAWVNKKCDIAYSSRRILLGQKVSEINSDKVKLVPRVLAKTAEDVAEIYSRLRSANYEGLILKKPDSMYMFKRTRDWLKLKSVNTADLECVGITAGTGKYDGLIGSLTCRGIAEGVEVIVSVGSGLSDADRLKDFIGEIIEVKYNSIIRSKGNGIPSLFLPRFVCVREDK